MEKHIISVLVENKFGVLARVSGLFSGRGYNIESLTVNYTEDPKVSRMTIVTSGDANVIEQIYKQLNKLIDVIKVTTIKGESFIERELLLIKVAITSKNRAEFVQLTELFKGRILTTLKDEITIELSGNGNKLKTFLELMSDFNIIEIVRTGRAAISRNAGKTEDYSDI